MAKNTKARDGTILKPDAFKLDTLSWLELAHLQLRTHQEALNSINLFPVADADTGSNMAGTLALALDDAPSISDRIQACLLGARGNSGTILAAWLAGFLEHFDEVKQTIYLSQAVKAGATRARAVLLKPVPGTMLDVMEALGNPQSMAIDAYKSIGQTALIQAKRLKTESASPDAGAVGFLLVINTLAENLGLAVASWEKIALFLPSPTAFRPQANSANSLEVELMFDLRISSDKEATLRDILTDLGNSVTISELSADEQSKHLAVHVHTAQEKKILKFLQRLGKLENLRTSQLTCQHD